MKKFLAPTLILGLLGLMYAEPVSAAVYSFDFNGATDFYISGTGPATSLTGGIATYEVTNPGSSESGSALLRIDGSNITLGSLLNTQFHINDTPGLFYASFYVDRTGTANTTKPYDALINTTVTDAGSGNWVIDPSSIASSVHYWDSVSSDFISIPSLWGTGFGTLASMGDWFNAKIIWVGPQSGTGYPSTGPVIVSTDLFTLTTVPEPASLLLLGSGLLGLAAAARRNGKK